MAYYHLTTKDKVASILKEGLKPSRGRNVIRIHDDEQKPCVYLTGENDIPYWAIVLGCDACIQVPVRSIQKTGLYYAYWKENQPSLYCESEHQYYKPIPPDLLKEIPMPTPIQMRNANLKLARHYISIISTLTDQLCRYYRHYAVYTKSEHRHTEEWFDRVFRILKVILPRVDFHRVRYEEIVKYLRSEARDGETMFTDTINFTDTRLWELLPQYPKDKFQKRRRWLYVWLIQNLQPYLYIKTGGIEVYESKKI